MGTQAPETPRFPGLPAPRGPALAPSPARGSRPGATPGPPPGSDKVPNACLSWKWLPGSPPGRSPFLWRSPRGLRAPGCRGPGRPGAPGARGPRVLMQVNAVVPVSSPSAAISACGKGKQPHTAMRLLPAMQPNALAPDVTSYRTAINACEKGAAATHGKI